MKERRTYDRRSGLRLPSSFSQFRKEAVEALRNRLIATAKNKEKT